MPGGPSSRGCEACRKQKKRCDQLKPSCSRCLRLKILCSGSGQQRFKFQEENSSFPSILNQPAHAFESRALVILPVLTSSSMSVTNAFVASLRVETPGYDLSCFGGTIFPQIPRRVGQNDALDASVMALTSAFYSMHTRQKQFEAQVQYGNAMKALRLYLQNPTKQATSDTLCAVWLLIMCQDWIGRHQFEHGDHYEGFSHILNAVASKQDWSDPFDVAIINVASMIVIIDSITNPKVQLGPWFQRFAEAYGPARLGTSDDYSMFRTLKLHSLAKIAEYIRNPELNRFGIEVAYREAHIDILRIKQRLVEIESPDSSKRVSQKLPAQENLKMLFFHQVAYGMIIQLTTILNYITRAFNPPNAQLNELHEASLFFADELINLARKIAPFRPLGASFITQALCAAWATTQDSARQTEIEDMLRDYETDLLNASYIPVAKWARLELEKLRRKMSSSRGLDSHVSATTEEISEQVRRVGARGRSCCFM